MTTIDILSGIRTASYAAPPATLTWPKTTQTTIDAYEKAWDAYNAALVDYELAEADTAAAPAADAELLTAAVRAGRPDPGEPNTERTARAVIVAAESLSQTHTALSIAQGVMEDTIVANPGNVLAQLAAHVAEATEAQTTAWREAIALIENANRNNTAYDMEAQFIQYAGITPNLNGWGISTPRIQPPTLDLGKFDADARLVATLIALHPTKEA